jgi:hypothetical protein
MRTLRLSTLQRTESASQTVIGKTIFIALTVIGGLALLIREGMILTGLLKGPILHMYEKYGDDEPFYYPLPRIFASASVLTLGLGFWLSPYFPGLFLPAGPALLMLVAMGIAINYTDVARRHPHLFQVLPRWSHDLREYTSREERRRIAYMWLDLPLRTKVLFNSSDRAFLHWADFIVLSTVADPKETDRWKWY